MNIAIIGSGKIGSVLARNLSKAGHFVIIGSRDTTKVAINDLIKYDKNIRASRIDQAVHHAEVVILAVPLMAIPDIAISMGEVTSKIIIDTSNGFGKTIPDYLNGVAAIKALKKATDVIRCFNTIGAEDLADPVFSNAKADAFMAGDSVKAKDVARKLALDLNFENCYDLGGDDALPLVENLALIWGALAYKAGLGRRIAFKILKD